MRGVFGLRTNLHLRQTFSRTNLHHKRHGLRRHWLIFMHTVLMKPRTAWCLELLHICVLERLNSIRWNSGHMSYNAFHTAFQAKSEDPHVQESGCVVFKSSCTMRSCLSCAMHMRAWNKRRQASCLGGLCVYDWLSITAFLLVSRIITLFWNIFWRWKGASCMHVACLCVRVRRVDISMCAHTRDPPMCLFLFLMVPYVFFDSSSSCACSRIRYAATLQLR